MKKQLYRVKQLADQKVGRAEKTDLLTEDLQHVEKTVERMKTTFQQTSKRLLSCIQTTGLDSERRIKKLNQMVFAQTMLECAQLLGDNSLLGGVMQCCGETTGAISGELANCEMTMDEQVLSPLMKVLETDIPNIQQTRKRLSKAGLDMDSSRTRWLTQVKTSHAARGDMAAAASKAEQLKDDWEDSVIKFEQCQDALATEMFTLVSREREYAEWMRKMMDAQMNYHKESLLLLEKALPSLRSQLDESMFRTVYGCPLEDHLRVNDREIAFVIEECIIFLIDIALETEGLFRLAGSSTKIKKLKAAFDAGIVDLSEYVSHIHAVTGALKQYFRDLPEPLLVSENYVLWMEANKIADRDARLQCLWTIVDSLPAANKANLKYLICFLTKLSQLSDVNKMTCANLAIVIGPNLLWSKDTEGLVSDTGNVAAITESLIKHCDWFFPGGVDFSRRESEAGNEGSNRQRALSSPRLSNNSDGVISGGLLSEVSKMFNLPEAKQPETTSEDKANDAPHSSFNRTFSDAYSDRPPGMPPRPKPGENPQGGPPYAGHRSPPATLHRSPPPIPTAPKPSKKVESLK